MAMKDQFQDKADQLQRDAKQKFGERRDEAGARGQMPERSDRERPERSERPERERPERSERPERAERVERRSPADARQPGVRERLDEFEV
ncbi:hypothetical protein QFZ75_003219 [Streptomyces sp. V3I8]|uniref:hypothetical protein n=1 Tax=Streptomyces sp. V3I8 TaxID=3042279 RepID=UPI00278A354B|nr:hypothetical protein [Streptomyces sp. V3I8]MDQ1036803.1 hypothetical protein [Streptomyces sp. V3I8]